MPDATTSQADYAAVLAPFGIAADSVALWGTGTPRREFLHVDDLAAAAVHLAENCSHEDVGEFVNVGCGRDLPIRKLAELVKDTVGFQGKIGWDSTKPDGMPRKLLDIDRIRALGWAPQIDLPAGIAATYAAYRATL
jgi:GDP-L-fucose synthase